MAIKKYNPTTPSRRQMSVSAFDEITGKSEIKSLMSSLKKTAGRNSYGRITVRHHGGGNKKQYRLIDFKREIEYITVNCFRDMIDNCRDAIHCVSFLFYYFKANFILFQTNICIFKK